MKLLYSILLVFTFVSGNLFSQELYKEKIQGKIVNTQIDKVSDSLSLHQVVTYRKSKYHYTFYLLGEKGLIKKGSFSIPKSQLISTHIFKNKYVLIYQIKKATYLIEYNYLTGIAGEIHKLPGFSYDILINGDQVSIFLSKEGDFIKAKLMYSFDFQVNHIYKPDNEFIKKSLPRFFDEKNYDLITDTYTEIGSINNKHAYLSINNIILTYDDKKTKTSFVLQMDYTKDGTYSIEYFKNKLKTNYLVRSIIKDGLLFQFALEKKTAQLNIYKITPKKLLKSFIYTKENFGEHNKFFYKGKERNDKFSKYFKGIDNSFSKYAPELFITVDKAEKDSYVVECGHINTATYYLDPFFQQQMMQPPPPPINIPRMGPNANYKESALYKANSLKKTSFILAINNKFEKLDTIPVIEKKKRWKKERKSLEKLKESYKYKHVTSLETKERFFYMHYYKYKMFFYEVKK